MPHRTYLLLSFTVLLAACNNDASPPEDPLADRPPSLIDPAGPFGPPQIPPVAPPRSGPEPDPQIELHLSLHGTDDGGGVHPVPGMVRLEWRDPENSELLGEQFGETDAQGNVELVIHGIVDERVYELSVTPSDDWYFEPDSVAYFYGVAMTGENLRETFKSPQELRFRPNDVAIVYLERLGTADEFPDEYPTGTAEQIVFEVTVSVPGLHAQFPTTPCDYFYRDLVFIDETAGPVATHILERPFVVDNCSHNDGKLSMLMERETAETPGFGSSVHWTSSVASDPVDDEEDVFSHAIESDLYYVEEDLFGQ